jgi:hypothetical protein
MRKRNLMFLFLVTILALCLANRVGAVNTTLIVQPRQEAVEKVSLAVSDASSARVVGNMSSDNNVKFYITSPSGSILLSRNETTYTPFEFTATENGTYELHVDNENSNNTSVELGYSIEYSIALQVQVRTWHTVSTITTSIIAYPPPTDFIEILKELLAAISTIGSVAALYGKILRFLRWLRWRIKYRKSRTPVTIQIRVPN